MAEDNGPDKMAALDIVAGVHAEKLLQVLREKPLFNRFSDEVWDELPFNLRHFIEATAFEASPTDPLHREQVAASMVGMWVLMKIESGDSLEDYPALKRQVGEPIITPNSEIG